MWLPAHLEEWELGYRQVIEIKGNAGLLGLLRSLSVLGLCVSGSPLSQNHPDWGGGQSRRVVLVTGSMGAVV